MEFAEVVSTVGNAGALTIIAGLFAWAYIQDKTKTQTTLAEIKDFVKALADSNRNFATSIELLMKNCMQVDTKLDRNYEAILNDKEKKI